MLRISYNTFLLMDDNYLYTFLMQNYGAVCYLVEEVIVTHNPGGALPYEECPSSFLEAKH